MYLLKPIYIVFIINKYDLEVRTYEKGLNFNTYLYVFYGMPDTMIFKLFY